MIDPVWGPFLFDTSAESWLARSKEPGTSDWWVKYLQMHSVHVSAVTVFERTRGYARLWRMADEERKASIEAARVGYLNCARRVWPIDTTTAIVAAEIAALVADPPTLPKRSHRNAESRTERLARWRFDGLIAATALVHGMTLVHNNAADFEAIRTAIETNPKRFPKVGPLNLIRCATVAELLH